MNTTKTPNPGPCGPQNPPDIYQMGRYQSVPACSTYAPYGPPVAMADDGYRVAAPASKAQTIEQIIIDTHVAVPPGDDVTAFLTDKRHTSRLGLDDVIAQIRRRYDIYHVNLYEIELSKCAAINVTRTWFSDPWMDVGHESEDLHKLLQAFYQQQRDERIKLWQDVSKLKLLLPESAQQYLSAHRKVAVLEDAGGDTS